MRFLSVKSCIRVDKSKMVFIQKEWKMYSVNEKINDCGWKLVTYHSRVDNNGFLSPNIFFKRYVIYGLFNDAVSIMINELENTEKEEIVT